VIKLLNIFITLRLRVIIRSKRLMKPKRVSTTSANLNGLIRIFFQMQF